MNIKKNNGALKLHNAKTRVSCIRNFLYSHAVILSQLIIIFSIQFTRQSVFIATNVTALPRQKEVTSTVSARQ